MKAPILLCVALLSGHSHDLAPKHEQGQVRRTSYSFEARRSLTGRSSIVNGEEHPGREGVRQEQTYSAEGVLVDRTVRVDDSTLMVFDREYEELELNMSVEVDNPFGADTDEEVSGESDLEGATVRFTREDDEFAAEFPEGEAGDEELLGRITCPRRTWTKRTGGRSPPSSCSGHSTWAATCPCARTMRARWTPQ